MEKEDKIKNTWHFAISKDWKLVIIIFSVPTIIATFKYGLNGTLGCLILAIGGYLSLKMWIFEAKVIWGGKSTKISFGKNWGCSNWGKFVGWAIILLIWALLLMMLLSF